MTFESPSAWLAAGVRIIAEAGVNHNGSYEMAVRLIDAAADAGADAVKFQTFRAGQLVTRSAAMAAYQQKATSFESQYAMLKALELPFDWHLPLKEHAARRGLMFLSTPFDAECASFLATTVGVPLIKIGSGDLTNAPLLLHVARLGKPVILSTGMATPDEIELALGALASGYALPDAAPSSAAFAACFGSAAGLAALQRSVVLLHCVTDYPARFEDANLRAIATLQRRFGLLTGYSDHTPGPEAPMLAVALGARLIEKHLTLDCDLPGPDHKASLDPGTFTSMVAAIRQTEAALGSGEKVPAHAETAIAAVARKSLVALDAIEAGELFSPQNLGVKRPGTGHAPVEYWRFLGRAAGKSYLPDEIISE